MKGISKHSALVLQGKLGKQAVWVVRSKVAIENNKNGMSSKPQPALSVIVNIAFLLSRNKGKFISLPFTEVELSLSLPVAQ